MKKLFKTPFARGNSVGDIERDVGKIALSTALAILYPPKGNRDNYCTAIAGVLKNHTEWSANEINQFVYNIASLSGKDENAGGKMAKGTNAYNDKTRNFGLPKLAEILNCSVGAVAKLFEWVGIKDSASQFTDLRVYKTEPKYWVFKFRDLIVKEEKKILQGWGLKGAATTILAMFGIANI